MLNAECLFANELDELDEHAKNDMFMLQPHETTGKMNLMNLWRGYFDLPRTSHAKRCATDGPHEASG
jgi:hypothetical protein